MFNSLSLRARFLVAPVIGVLLTLVLYYASTSIIQSHTEVFSELKESNLPLISQSSHTSILLADNHSALANLLLEAQEHQDEERVYIDGRVILDNLHKIEGKLLGMHANRSDSLIIDGRDIIPKIKKGFIAYREASISAIELSTVNIQRAHDELRMANRALHILNAELLILSDYYVDRLNESSYKISEALDDTNYLTLTAAILVIIMVLSAIYFSNNLSAGIEQLNKALIGISQWHTDTEVPRFNGGPLEDISTAINNFKGVLLENNEQRKHLNQAVAELKESENRYYTLLDLSPTSIVAINDEQKIVLFNKTAEDEFGFNRQEVIGKSLSMLLPEQFRERHQSLVNNFKQGDTGAIKSMKRTPVAALRSNGEVFYADANIAKMQIGGKRLMSVSLTDVTERKLAEDKVQHQAHYDSLTDLPNRSLSLDRLEQLVSKAQRSNELVAILFLDLDGFKKINDTMGHEAGDAVLIETANRLRNSLRLEDTVGRLGGDEFIILLDGLPRIDDARSIAENILEQFRDTFTYNDRELVLTASIGISIYPDDGNNSVELLRKADSAMYHSKKQTRNNYSYFTEAMNRDVHRRLALEEQLHGAVERGEFSVCFQTQVEVSTENIVGVEALLRWQNPALGSVSPDEFIPIAEQTGLIIPIGRHVITLALNVISKWHREFDPELLMAINLSPVQFRDPELTSFIKDTADSLGIPGKYIELEVTEGILMDGYGNIHDTLEKINNMDISVTLDDFGTGYSSLSYLRHYSFKALKIDRTFVSNLHSNQTDRELVNAAIAMAHALNMKVVAEGVENDQQLSCLKEVGCDYAQGYYFSKPLPASVIEHELRKT